MSRQLPPMNAVRVFVVAARHLNFARTAEELNVTQSAVSKQISTLEAFIGTRLFERESSGVSLTLEGRQLKQSVTPAFDILEQSFRRFSAAPSPSQTVRLATVASLAAQFLVPRLKSFETRYPNIHLDVLTSDRVLDLSRESVDVSVRYGSGDWNDVVATKLRGGKLIPVCSADVFRGHANDVEQVLGSERRIQLFLKNEWGNFSARGALNRTLRPYFVEHFLVAVQSVLHGRAIALLPRLIVHDLLASGDLIQLEQPVSWEDAFYLCHHKDEALGAATISFVDWLQRELASVGS